VQAVEHLDAAARALESLGFVKEAEVIITLLQKMADGKKDETSEEEPKEVFEMGSLLRDSKDSEDDDLGEQVIEMRSIASAVLKKKV
jgi:hypothetical protein